MGTLPGVVMSEHLPAGRSSRHGDGLLLALVVLLVLAAWAVARSGWFQAGDDVGYWLGVLGGTLMLVLMLYPVRKRWKPLRSTGSVRHWFWMHMVCGIAGPWLILVHSTFRIGSLNAGVALASMLTVVASGVIGRFLFVRVQHQLAQGQASLAELRGRLGLAGGEMQARLDFAPELARRLREFEAREVPADPASTPSLLRQLGLPLRLWLKRLRSLDRLQRELAAHAQARGWDEERTRQAQRRLGRLLRRWFDAVLRVAHYRLFDRLFALWHVAHLPFVVLLVVSAVVHVVAVHAY